MFVRIASRGTFAGALVAASLLLPHVAHAFPDFAPQNCSGCHGNPTLTSTPANGGTLNFGNTLVGQTSSANFTITNSTNTAAQALPGGGFTGTYSGASGAFAPTTQAGITGGVVSVAGQPNYLTPGLSDTRGYTFSPTGRGTVTAPVTFTVTNGFDTATSVSITLQGRGVAPIVDLDTTLTNAGNVRIGTAKSAQLTVTNTGDGNLSGKGDESNLHGTVGSGSGAFSGSGGTFNLGDGASQSFSFSFAPTAHGSAGTNVNVSTTNGSADGQNRATGPTAVALSGTGVGPTYHSSVAPGGSLSFSDATHDATLSLSNITADADLGDLTNLTLLSAQITGADGGLFSLLNFAPGSVLGKGDSFDLHLAFDAAAGPGPHSAVLTLMTDEGAALGASGDAFTYTLLANGATPPPPIPEPDSLGLMLAGLVAMGAVLRRRKKASARHPG